MDLHELERHELSAIWGDMPEDERHALEKSVAEHGVELPITLCEGKVLDGWHRLQAAIKAGEDAVPIDPDEPADPADFVIRRNGFRRQLSKGQRVTIVLMARKWRKPGRPGAPLIGEKAVALTEQQLAAEAGTSVSLVQEAKKRIREGKGEEVASGKVTLASLRRQDKQRKRAKQAKPLTRMEKLTAENAELRARLDAQQTQLDEQGRRLEMLGDAEVDKLKELNADLHFENQRMAKMNSELIEANRRLKRRIEFFEAAEDTTPPGA